LCNSNEIDVNLLTKDLPLLVLKSIGKVSEHIPKQVSRSKDILFSKAIVYIDQHLQEKIKTIDVCTALKISERNLRYIFKEMMGLLPMKFIKCLKLNKARKSILSSGKEIDINKRFQIIVIYDLELNSLTNLFLY